jgi:hypothetical protein
MVRRTTSGYAPHLMSATWLPSTLSVNGRSMPCESPQLAHSRKLAGGARAGPHLLWGGFCQGGAPKGPIHFLILQFLCSTWAAVSSPRSTLRVAGARRSGQGWPAHWAATDRLGLDGFEHDGILVVVGMTTSEGSSHAVDEHSRPHPSIRWAEDPDHDAVMRIGSESSEAADPFWGTAFEAMVRTGTPPPRTVIGDPVTRVQTGARNRRVFCDRVPPFSVRDGGRRPRARRRRARGATRR